MVDAVKNGTPVLEVLPPLFLFDGADRPSAAAQRLLDDVDACLGG
jgi:hypothetical protein